MDTISDLIGHVSLCIVGLICSFQGLFLSTVLGSQMWYTFEVIISFNQEGVKIQYKILWEIALSFTMKRIKIPSLQINMLFIGVIYTICKQKRHLIPFNT